MTKLKRQFSGYYRKARASNASANRIIKLGSLKDGWHFGEGRSIGHAVILDALSVAASLGSTRAETIEAFPEQDGGIMLSAYLQDKQMDIIILHDRSLEVFYIDGDTEASLAIKDLKQLDVLIGGLGWRTRKSLGFYIHSTTVAQRNVIRESHLKIAPLAEFQFSKLDAPVIKVAQSASTSTHSMDQTWLVIQPSSGVFGRTPYRRVHA